VRVSSLDRCASDPTEKPGFVLEALTVIEEIGIDLGLSGISDSVGDRMARLVPEVLGRVLWEPIVRVVPPLLEPRHCYVEECVTVSPIAS
jgi:hypothetical protein